jgi:putative RecB family exonuclease
MSLELEVDPNDVADELTGRDYISWSAVSTYQACPLRWHFRYCQNLPETVISSSLVFGSAIHQAAELHYRELLSGNPAPDVDTLLEAYQSVWQERDLAAIKFGKDEDINSLGELAERVLTAFQQCPLANPSGQIVGVEEELRGRIVEECPELLARVDLLVDEGNELVVTDLKTAKSRWRPHQANDSGGQLLLYSELAKELLPGKSIRLQFLVITKAKSPVVEAHTVSIDPARIKRTRSVVRQVWQAMRRGVVYPNPSPMNCPSCPFQEPCRRWQG